MTRFAALASIALLAAALAPRAWAQAANPEPGYCAQFYPDADCNSIGSPTPGAAKAVERESRAAPSAAMQTPPATRTKKHQANATAPAAK